MSSGHNKVFLHALMILGIFLGVRYLLPLALPFLLGLGLALAAEPMVNLFSGRMRLPRALAAGLGVSMAFCFLALVLLLLGALVVREVGVLARVIPDLEETARTGISTLAGWLKSLAALAPDGVENYLIQNIDGFFSNGTALLDRAAGFALDLASTILSHVPSGALSITTALIASYMISAKLPKIRTFLSRQLGTGPVSRIGPAWRRMKNALGGWLLAQLKLSGITFAIVTMGFVLLRVPYAPAWAAMVAVVDALPVLGTGTVLVPWSIVCFLQGSQARGIGLLGIYALVMLTRSVMEPRLVGRHLGLDPLVTLMAFYVGYKVWGIAGMILAPMLAAAIFQMVRTRPEEA